MKMKKIYILFLVCFVTIVGYGQAKKPKLMIIPSRTWFVQNHFMTTHTNAEGQQIEEPDFQKAFDENPDVSMVISAMQDFMTRENYKVEDLKAMLGKLKSRSARDNMTTAGGGLQQSTIDMLNKTAKADIIVELYYTIKKDGPYKYVEFNVGATDAYSAEPISQGNIGRGTSANGTQLVNQLEEAVLSFKDKFISDMDSYYQKLFESGRHIVVRLTLANNCDINYEKEYQDKELSELIEDWIAAHAMKGNYNLEDKTENEVFFDEVRIPMTYTTANGQTRGTTADWFGRELKKYIEETTGVKCKIDVIGLGEINIILGGKS